MELFYKIFFGLKYAYTSMVEEYQTHGRVEMIVKESKMVDEFENQLKL